ncbi:endopeptidase La [Peredibacter starrii]|uniref:Lon protease n=1 Tax=Peredibacter starrii TaxID=28202 RepID=A0AAX4HV42_9BACT|nr:endopeptidase La [Peredibacter starrii]WPU66819.1 endopeptidase La [Peredibacter starrii]
MQLLPVLSVRESVILPGSALPLRVGRKQSIEAVEAAQKNGNMILAVSQKSGYDHDHVEIDDLRTIGTLAQIDRIRGNAKDGYQIFLRGVSRYRVNQFSMKDGYIAAAAEEWKDVMDGDPSTFATMLDVMKNMSEKILQLLPNDTRLLSELVKEMNDLSHLTYLTAANLDIDSQKKQEILETAGLKDRSLKVLEAMQKMKDELEVQVEIRNKLGHKLGKHQRETILREQLRTIQEELGDIEKGEEKDDLRKKIVDAGMPEETLKVALDEFKRLESMGPNSPESHVIRNYLDLLVALPWKKNATESEIADLDLEKAREILDAEHYGLDKIKKRVLQHLAVMKLKKTSRGQILLLVGPPGVGKTSLGQSIAKALGRKFVRGSLGGVRDDAEIRGHRRTYIGAMPGRIIQGIKRAGENNPVFMLDEIDKLGRGFQGDPAAALLEVLDPEQNATFLDHYLDVPFDLSNVFFIATANSLDTIPCPLLDRMEIIDLSGYTTAEKLHIAKNHLIPKQWTEHGLSDDQLVISDEALLKLINSYTREAGVRDLQRKIVTLCRAMAEKVLSKDSVLPIRIELADIEEVFGNERFTHEVANTMNPPGVATGLAWTPQGGEILFIEANLMPGKGSLILTGQLGEVMRESTQIALSLVRSRLAHAIPGFEFERKDIHVHVPAGAIPKDGPSAGITMLTTIASLLTGRSISPKLAMTGELTLRGAVMPVGGIKEKLIAAHRAGIEKVILSKRNQKDLKDVPEEVRHGLKIELVETAAEVLKIALDLDATEDFVPQGFKENIQEVPTAM